MTPKFHTIRVSEIRKETEDTVSIAFDIPNALKSDYQYLSGQYLTLKTIIDGQDIRRSYSLCSSPHENEYRVAVKQVENGTFSTFCNNQLKSGDALEVMTPMGSFQLKPETKAAKNYALFAAGSGITPIISILKTILKEEPDSTISFFYGNKNFNSIIFREELEGLKNKYMDQLRIVHVLSRESLGNDIQKGRLDKQKCGDLYDAFLNQEKIDAVYICGPEQMIIGVKECLLEKGIEESKIHLELFTTPGIKNDEAKKTKELENVDSNVTVIIDGDAMDLSLTTAGVSILDAALQAGADLPFACKGGVCCTCKAKILEGTAQMDINYALEKDEVEAGYILTCQSHPTSKKLIVSFDE